MNTLECQYWDKMASMQISKSGRSVEIANTRKYKLILQKLLNIPLLKKSVLEIGIGTGVIYSALKAIHCNAIKYSATDVSKIYCDFCNVMWKLIVKQADATALPYDNHSFDYVFAFDVFEHVKPEERDQAYKEIDRVLKPDGAVVFNIPVDKGRSKHDIQFDHGYVWKDFAKLAEICKAEVASFNVYTIHYASVNNGSPDVPKQYIWAIAERHL